MNNSYSSNEFSNSYNSTHFSQIIPSSVIELPNGGTKRLRQKENYVDIMKEKLNYQITDIINKKDHKRLKSYQDKSNIKTDLNDINRKKLDYNKIFNHSASPSKFNKSKKKN